MSAFNLPSPFLAYNVEGLDLDSDLTLQLLYLFEALIFSIIWFCI